MIGIDMIRNKTESIVLLHFTYHVCHCTECRKQFAGKFINLAKNSLTAKNKSDTVQYEICHAICRTINHKNIVLWFYNKTLNSIIVGFFFFFLVFF